MESSSLLSLQVWSKELDQHDPFSAQQVRLAYERARTVVKHYNMTADDLINLTPKFWDFNRSYISARDFAVFTILAMHWNLALGTIASYRKDRPDLEPLIKDLEDFNVSGLFLLTELDHGLDTRNLETQAVRQGDGSFVLNTPHLGAAKTMPPNGLWGGVARLAIVYARLIDGITDHGIKMFLVPLCTADRMAAGVTSRVLPRRTGSRALDHTITTFDGVRLPPTALLGGRHGHTAAAGGLRSDAAGADRRADFLRQIWRLAIGSLALSMASSVPLLRVSALVAARYSQRRAVGGGDMGGGEGRAVVSYATSYRPILDALVLARVFDCFAQSSADMIRNEKLKPEIRMAVAHTFKATVSYWTEKTLKELMVRVGWQAMYSVNQISENYMNHIGSWIAEGEVMMLCIRLATELLLDRYQLPEPTNPNSQLARYEAGLWAEARRAFTDLAGGDHRSRAFNTYMLPRAQPLVRAIGCRMAYDAAVAAQAAGQQGDEPQQQQQQNQNETQTQNRQVLALFESTVAMDDLSWYVEHEGARRADASRRDAHAAEVLLPQLEALLAASGAEPWVTAPMVSAKACHEWILGLPAETGAAAAGKNVDAQRAKL